MEADSLQISQLSKSLEKSTQSEDLGAIKDTLAAINGLTMSATTIKKSSLGQQISNLRKRYHQHLGTNVADNCFNNNHKIVMFIDTHNIIRIT